MTRITSLHGTHTSPVVLYMQNNVISFRNTSLYGSQPSSVVFSCKTATLEPELQVSMCPRLHLRFFAFKTATLAPELQVSIGPSSHLWFLHSKQGLSDQNYNPLWVPDLTYVFCIQNSVFINRIASLYGSQPSSVVFAFKTATFGSELQVSMGPRPHLCFLHSKQRLYHQNCKSLWVPALICGFCIQNSDFRIRITSLYGPHTSPVILCMKNSVISNRTTSLPGSQTSPVIL